jgi:hypothetical protein
MTPSSELGRAAGRGMERRVQVPRGSRPVPSRDERCRAVHREYGKKVRVYSHLIGLPYIAVEASDVQHPFLGPFRFRMRRVGAAMVVRQLLQQAGER